MVTLYDQPIAPRRCPECGGVMVWGQMRWSVTSVAIRHAEAPFVERADMRGKWYPVTINVCTQCGHIGFYIAYPLTTMIPKSDGADA